MGAGFTVWVTGPDPRAVEEVAAAVAGRLAARRVLIETLDSRTPGIDVLAGEGVEGRASFVAGLLARHGVVVIVALPSPRRAAREQARAALGRMIEVHVCAGGPPGSYEAPQKPEVEIVLPDSGAGVERTVRTLEVLGLLPSGQDLAYSAEEEREVIRRLKAFGYL